VRQAKAIPIILQARSIEAGCAQAGLSKARFYKWLKESEEFAKAYKQQRDVLIDEAMESLKASIAKAVDTLTGLLDSNNESLRRAVANDILTHIMKMRELQDIESRLESIERVVLERKTYR
jgi:ABC-type transporter Mla subunit MlaD